MQRRAQEGKRAFMENAYFYFGSSLRAEADRRLNNGTIRELFQGFCFRGGKLELKEGREFHFRAGDIEYPEVSKEQEYRILVTEQGMAVSANDYSGLVRGLMVLLMRIEEEESESFRVAACCLESSYIIKNRMIHLCVFPETPTAFLRKYIRLAGVMQYTHVVLEFWGMLKYDCLKELSWDNALSKDEVRGLLQEIEDLGMEAIPMLNHLGHGSACRLFGGKHVVLDQNPRLHSLFTPDGWSWNIKSQRVRGLLKEIRKELYELFDKASYIHLGCDEVYSFEKGEENQSMMREYLQYLTEVVVKEGRFPILWGDMLLNAKACQVEEPYFCGCETEEASEKLLAAISPKAIIADWHYGVTETPVKTSVYLKKRGFQVLGAPWFHTQNCEAFVKTVQEYDLAGIMVTTWHTLAQKMPHVVRAALLCGAYHSPWSGETENRIRTETAVLLRKVYFTEGNYREAGWAENQITMEAEI